MSETKTLDELKIDISKAHEELFQLCGGKKFLMSLPVKQTDTDIVLDRGLVAGLEAVSRAESAEAETYRLRDFAQRIVTICEDPQYRTWYTVSQMCSFLDEIRTYANHTLDTARGKE